MTDTASIAQAEFEAEHYSRAVQFAQYALAREPDEFESLLILGRSLLKLGEVFSGVDALEHAALIRPLKDQVRVELAIGYGILRRRSLSRDLLMAVAVGDDVEATLLLKIATGLEAIDEPRLAMEACRQAGRKLPDSGEVAYQMGYYANICGYPVNICEALIRHAINLDSRNLHYRIGLASLLIRLGRKCEAIATIDRLIPDRVEEVTCLCCLKRIANLFFDCDDLPRAKLCAARLAALEEGGSSTDPSALRASTPREAIRS